VQAEDFLKVLVIEDDPLMLRHVGEMLLRLDHDVLLANTVDAGLKLVRQREPDAAVVDILMPDKDGLNFILEVGRERNMRIVAITGGGRLGPGPLLKMAEGLGAHATLVKPFSEEQLQAALLG
jgi:DNA-binding response OmpR family regulator